MRRRFIMLTVPVAALAFSAGGATAHAAGSIGTTTVYVSTTGSDSNPCTRAQPCATLQYAVDNAPAGATINVGAGKYNQTVNITKPLTLAGAGASKTVIDGSNIDTGSKGYYSVVSVQNNTGAGGAINIKGFTIDNAFVTALEVTQSEFPIDLSVYNDSNAADSIRVSNVVLGAVQDTADYGGIGFYTFNDVAPVTFTDSTTTGNFQGALLEGGGIGGSVTVTHVDFTRLVPCAGACSGSSTVYPAEGLFVLSDQPGTANATISHNSFHNYAGDGIDASAGYSGGNCAGSAGPCTGNVNVTEASNTFSLGACAPTQNCAAIHLDAQAGNQLTALIKNNKGTVHRPDQAIVEKTDAGVYSVTQIDNHIRVV